LSYKTFAQKNDANNERAIFERSGHSCSHQLHSYLLKSYRFPFSTLNEPVATYQNNFWNFSFAKLKPRFYKNRNINYRSN